MNALESGSTRPYLIRALYEWCTDNGYTPYIAARVDETVQVPREYVKNDEIVLNISYDATSSLKLGNEFIEFKARFAGKARDIMVPMSRVMAIYARENGQGMAFPPITQDEPESVLSQSDTVASHGKSTAPELQSATPQADGDAGPKIVPLQAVTKTEGDDPKDPRPPSGPRPALKRVK